MFPRPPSSGGQGETPGSPGRPVTPIPGSPLSPLRRFITNIFWTVSGKACVQFLLFAVSVLLTRYLGTERLGIYATLLVIPAFVRLLNSLGLETLINKKLPELNVHDPSGRQGRFLVRRLVSGRLFATLGFCGLLYWLLPYYLAFIQQPELLRYRTALIVYFFVITLDSMMSTLFMTLLRYKVVAVTETVCSMLNLGFLAVFIFLDFGIFGILYAYILSLVVNLLIYLGLSMKDMKGETEPPDWGEMPHLAWVSYAISLLSFGLMTQSDIVIMNYFQVDNEGIGYYHLATGLAAMLAFVVAGVGPLALSIFSETYARDSAAGLSKVWCEIVGFCAFLTAPIYVFALCNAESLLTFVYGTAFSGAAVVFSLYVLFAGVQTVLGTNFTVSTLFVIQRRDVAMRSTVEGSLANVVLNLILIPRYGVMGAVAATGSVMVYMVLRQLFAIKKEIDILPVFPAMGRSFLYSLAAVLPAVAVARMGHILLSAAVYLLVFVGVLAWRKPFTEEHRHLIAEVQPGLDRWLRWFIEKTPQS